MRIRSSTLPEPTKWLGPEMPYKERQIAGLERRGGASVIFLGSSTVDVSVDASLMHLSPSARPAYNASTGAASIRMIDTWARVVAVPRLTPKVVFLGISSRELTPNDPFQVDLEKRFFTAPEVEHQLGTGSVIRQVERRVGDWSALFRYRTGLRDPANLARLLGLAEPADPNRYGQVVADDGQYLGFLDTEFRVTEDLSPALFRDYEVGDAQLETVRRLIAFVQNADAQLVLVNMPVTPTYVALHPHKEADYDRYRQAIAAVAADAGVRYIDAGVWPEALFADPAHLNRAGSLRLTSLLDQTLSELGAS